MIDADLLIILTSVEGRYDRDPSDPEAVFILDVSQHLASSTSISALVTGGMPTKMRAARPPSPKALSNGHCPWC